MDAISQTDTQIWSHLFKTTVNLVRQLYTRDTRRQFCPEHHWINDRITLPLDRPNDISFRRSRLRQYRPFRGLRVFTREELGESFYSRFSKSTRALTSGKKIAGRLCVCLWAILTRQKPKMQHAIFKSEFINQLNGCCSSRSGGGIACWQITCRAIMMPNCIKIISTNITKSKLSLLKYSS